MIGRKDVQTIRRLAVGIIMFHVMCNVMYFLPEYVYINIFINEQSFQDINLFTMIPTLAVTIAPILNKTVYATEEIQLKCEDLFKKYIKYTLLFFMYLIFCVIKWNVPMMTSAMIMIITYIDFVFLTRLLTSLNESDYQVRWKKAMNQGVAENVESNIFWRLKIWVSPREAIPFEERFKLRKNIFLILFIFYSIKSFYKINIEEYSFIELITIGIILLVVYRDILIILDAILGLQTSMTGICTGIQRMRRTHHGNRIYYQVYVTDYKNRRGIYYKSYNAPYFNVNDEVTLIHGVLSKVVYRVNEIKINSKY